MGMKGWITEAEFDMLIKNKIFIKDFSFNKIVPCTMYSTKDNTSIKLPTDMFTKHILVKEIDNGTRLFEAINDFTYENICKEHCNKQKEEAIKARTNTNNQKYNV